MKISTLSFLAILLFPHQRTWALAELFKYSDGNLVAASNNLWTTWSGSVMANMVSGKVQLSAVNSGADVARPIPGNNDTNPEDNGMLYVRLKLRVSTLPNAYPSGSSSPGSYFLSYKDSGANCRGRLFILLSSAGKFKLGISYASTAPDVITANEFTTGNDYTVVMKLNTATKAMSLWITPVANPITEDPAAAITTTSTVGSLVPLGMISLRQDISLGGMGTLTIDDLVVGESWPEVYGDLFDVTTYGATVNNSSDSDRAGIQSAIAAVKTHNANPLKHGILVFPTGAYQIDGSGLVNGSGVVDGNPANNYIELFCKDIVGFVMDGSGSSILMKNTSQANTYLVAQLLYLNNCDNAVIKELSIDWDRPTYTVGTVGTVVPEIPSGSWTMKWTVPVTLDTANYPVPNNSANWDIYAITDFDSATGLPISNMTIRNGIPGVVSQVYSGSTNPTSVSITVQTKSTNADSQAHFTNAMPALSGKKVVLRHPVGANNIYGPNCIDAYLVDTITFQDITIHSSAGMGIKASTCTDLLLKRVRLEPSNGRLLSTPVDGTFFTFCDGPIDIWDCHYKANGDDSANVHGKFLRAQTTPISGTTVYIGTQDGTARGPLPYAHATNGEQFEFLKWDDHGYYLNGAANFIGKVTSASAVTLVDCTVTSLTRAGTTVSVTTSASHGFSTGDWVNIRGANAGSENYNGNFSATVTGSTTFTYTLNTSQPAAGTFIASKTYGFKPLQQIYRVTFDSLPAGFTAGDYVISKKYRPALVVKNSTFDGGLARGLLVSTAGATISHCDFVNYAFNGIMMFADPTASGCQGPGPNAITVDDCLFSGCGASPICSVSPSGSNRPRASVAGTFKNLTIRNNLFEQDGASQINALRLMRTSAGSYLSYYHRAGLSLTAIGGTNLIQGNIWGGTTAATGFEPAVFLSHISSTTSFDNNSVTGQTWIRTHITSPVGNDPVPTFVNGTAGTKLDLTDQDKVSGGGIPTTNDNDFAGYARQLPDLRN